MPNTPIESIEDLQSYLQVAIKLEHATIPPYLTAMYSIKPGTNYEAYNVIRVVAVEEMLHMALAANTLNAVGGCPNLLVKDFVQNYPADLPTGQKDFRVDLQRFSREALKTFLKIERPSASSPVPMMAEAVGLEPMSSGPQMCDGICYVPLAERESRPSILPVFHYNAGTHIVELCFQTIGEFYKAITRGIEFLCDRYGEQQVFSGAPERQVGPEHYYSGGGDIVKVTDKASALTALRLIAEQGEGEGGGIYDKSGELAHYFRFQQLDLEKFYCEGDEPGQPSGHSIPIDYKDVYPIAHNAKLAQYPCGSELLKEAEAFNRNYGEFLQNLNTAFNGRPELLLQAVPGMFRIKEKMRQLMRIPLDANQNAAPTFEIPPIY